MSPVSRPFFWLLFFILFPFVCSLDAARWREITPEEFALTEPVVDPEYGAEILFSESVLKQTLGPGGLLGSFQVYNRTKVYNEKGVEQLSNFELPYTKGAEISRIEGRTVKPDGTVYELEKNSIFDQEVLRKGRRKVRAKSLVFPNLEPGDIIELQYTQRAGRHTYWVEVDFLSSLPAQRVYRSLKPVPEIGSRISAFQFPDADLTMNRRGYYEFELTNLPAKKSEPYAPPEMHSGPYVLLYYYFDEPDLDVYWRERAKELYKEGRTALKPSRDIQKFVKSSTSDAESDLDRLRMLYQYCQEEITNHEYSFGVYTEKELEDLPENKSPQHTFSRGHGTRDNINALFGSMARALGYEVQLANANDNRFMLFSEAAKVAFALKEECVAVELNGRWHFFNPGNPFLPFDSLEWWSCGSGILVGDAKNGALDTLPVPTAAYSTRHRRGVFSIDEVGTLKGTVTEWYGGYQDLDMKEELASKLSPDARERFILQELKENQAQATLSNLAIINRGSSIESCQISYDLEIPEYADITGKRIFVQPAVFQKGVEPLFTDDRRQFDILFPYPWTETDDILIQIPEGFVLEEGSAPQLLDLGQIGVYETELGMAKTNVIKYSRVFAMELMMIQNQYYSAIKEAFTLINQLDQHLLTFKREEAPAN